MPCLNEAKTVETCIRKAQKSILENHLSAEIIIADNGSSDNSIEVAKRCGARVVPIQEKGYGAALIGGFEAAQGEFIIMGDADDSYDFSNLLPFVEKLREGYDLVMGCRLPEGGGKIMPHAMPWLHRWIGNPILSFIGRLFFHSPIHDFHCGMRGFKKSAFEKMELKTTGMELASEMVVKATLKKMRVTNIPITLYKDGRDRPPHLRSFRDGWRHLRFMLLFSPRWLFFIPGMVFFLVGSLASSLLMSGPITMGHVEFNTNTLLMFSLFMLAGFQLVSFAMFTKIFAISEGLLPPDPRLEKVFKLITLETGLLMGVTFCGGGFVLLVSGVIFWAQNQFGFISYPASLRLIIPGVVSVTLGIQIIFSSFFMSILGLKRR